MKSVGVRIRAVRRDRGSPTSVLFPLYFSVLSILIPYISRLFIYSAHISLSRCFFHPRPDTSEDRSYTTPSVWTLRWQRNDSGVFPYIRVCVCVCVCVICAGETCVSSVFESTVLFVCEERVCVCEGESERERERERVRCQVYPLIDPTWEWSSLSRGSQSCCSICVCVCVCEGV